VVEVECITLDGNKRLFPSERLILRPAVYGVIVDKGKLLLLRMRETGKFHLPGGGIHIGERMTETLSREIQEEAGIEIEVVRFVHFEEVFFYYDPSDRVYHGLHFFFICKPKNTQLLPDDQVDDDSAGQPRWVEISGLHPDDFQYHGELIMGLCKQIDV
jgi:ADP-ribose pyrophosphatase YjhB (NUDIX family)